MVRRAPISHTLTNVHRSRMLGTLSIQAASLTARRNNRRRLKKCAFIGGSDRPLELYERFHLTGPSYPKLSGSVFHIQPAHWAWRCRYLARSQRWLYHPYSPHHADVTELRIGLGSPLVDVLAGRPKTPAARESGKGDFVQSTADLVHIYRSTVECDIFRVVALRC